MAAGIQDSSPRRSSPQTRCPRNRVRLPYAYDDAGQLTTQTTDRSTGPRAPPTTPVTTSTYTWDPLGQVGQVTGTETGAYGFTSTGQVTQLPNGTTLAYDTAGQVTTRTTPAEADGTPGQATNYAYNTLGQRTGATSPDGKTTSYTYDQTGKLTTLTDATGATSTYTYEATGLRATTTTAASTQRFVWDTTTSVPELLSDSTHQYVYGTGSTPLAQTDTTTGTVDYLHTDLTGSVRTITDQSGDVIADSDYTAYGTPTNVTGTPISAVTAFGFAGQYTDPTGLLYLRARYYDPTTTQFLTIDPLLATTHLPYAYTPGNPLLLGDPLGLDSFLGDIGHASWGAALGLFDVARGIVDAPANTVRTVLSLPAKYREGGGGWGGIGLAVNQLNPVYRLLVDVNNGWELASHGCTTEAARAFTHATADTVAVAGLAAGGASAAAARVGGASTTAAGGTGGGFGAGSGPWAEGVASSEGGAVGQLTGGSCVSACGQMLSNGAVTQSELLGQIGEWSNPARLADALGDGWQGGYFGSGADALAAAERGPMGAALQAGTGPGHMVVTSPLGDGAFLVRDPWAGGSTYTVGSNWIEQYVAGGTFR